MNKLTSVSLAAALFGAASMAGGAMTATSAMAYDGKCYGISKAGENDCGNAAGTHTCAGQSTVDYDGGEWKAVASAEECTQLGGSATPFDGVNEKKTG
ncbi:MAG: hypothetical protein Kilf2KO_38790 [Rhodospirillales bacterium]